MGSHGIHPWLLSELAVVAVLLLSTIFEKSWRMGELPDDWRNANVISIFKKGKKESPGNNQPESLISIPAMIMEKVILEVITKNIKEKKVIRSSQRRLFKGESSLTNLTFCDRLAGWINEERAVDLSILTSQGFCAVSHGIRAAFMSRISSAMRIGRMTFFSLRKTFLMQQNQNVHMPMCVFLHTVQKVLKGESRKATELIAAPDVVQEAVCELQEEIQPGTQEKASWRR
nr:uncharacterized protein LOC113459031 [Zonotrichia albicollis]